MTTVIQTPTTIQTLLADTATHLTGDGTGLHHTATPNYGHAALTLISRRRHNHPALLDAHREASRAYDRMQLLADSAIRREKPHTAASTQIAVDRANAAWERHVEARALLELAEEAVADDVAQALTALGDLPEGLTRGQAIDHYRATACACA